MHSVIPHHLDDEHFTDQTTTHDQDHDDDDDHSPLSHAFDLFEHDFGGIVVSEPSNPSFHCALISVDKKLTEFIQYVISSVEKPPLIHWDSYQLPPISLAYSNCKLFRGPPSLMA